MNILRTASWLLEGFLNEIHILNRANRIFEKNAKGLELLKTKLIEIDFDETQMRDISFNEEDGTVTEVESSSGYYGKIGIGWKALKAETKVGKTIMDGFNKQNDPKDCTILFAVSGDQSNLPKLMRIKDTGIDVQTRLLVLEISNCKIQEGTFQSKLFLELMWPAPWDYADWKELNDEFSKKFEQINTDLALTKWDKVEEKSLSSDPRDEELRISERIVQNFDRFQGTNNKFRPNWKPRVEFTNMREKEYDELNYGADSYAMVNIENIWYTVWRRSFSKAVFSATYDLNNFPWDVQVLDICLMATHPMTRVNLINHKAYRSSANVLKNKIHLPEWEYQGMRVIDSIDKSARFHKFTFQAVVRRRPEYFINSARYMFSIITFLAFISFAIPAEQDKIGERLAYGGAILLTSVSFKWVISEKIPNLKYATYLDNFSLKNFNTQICIILANGAMIFMRKRDENGEIDSRNCQIYDLACFAVIFTVWFTYHILDWLIFVPNIISEECNKLIGMTWEAIEKVEPKKLESICAISRSYSPNDSDIKIVIGETQPLFSKPKSWPFN